MDEINQSANFQQPQVSEPVEQSAQQSVQKSKNIFKYLFFVLLILFLGIIISGYFLLTKKINTLSQSTPTSTQTNIVNNTNTTPTITINQEQESTVFNPETILLSLQEAIGTSAPIKSDDVASLSWLINEEGTKATYSNNFKTFSLAAIVSNQNVGKYGNYTSTDEVTLTSLKELKSTINEFFTTNGFEKNSFNTFNDEVYNMDYMGFSKGNLRCLIKFEPQIDPFGHFNCGVFQD